MSNNAIPEPKRLPVRCPNCSEQWTIHEPSVVVKGEPNYSMALIVPSWSLDERRCKRCGLILAPCFVPQKVMMAIAWTPFGKPDPEATADQKVDFDFEKKREVIKFEEEP
jgi:hypothetical protein